MKFISSQGQDALAPDTGGSCSEREQIAFGRRSKFRAIAYLVQNEHWDQVQDRLLRFYACCRSFVAIPDTFVRHLCNQKIQKSDLEMSRHQEIEGASVTREQTVDRYD